MVTFIRLTNMKKITRENIADHLMEYQLAMVGKRIEDIMDDDKWKEHFAVTSKQRAEFKRYAIPLLEKTFKFNRSRAEATYAYFISTCGVRIKNQ